MLCRRTRQAELEARRALLTPAEIQREAMLRQTAIERRADPFPPPQAVPPGPLRVLADVDTADIGEVRIRYDAPHLVAHLFHGRGQPVAGGSVCGRRARLRPSAPGAPAPPHRVRRWPGWMRFGLVSPG